MALHLCMQLPFLSTIRLSTFARSLLSVPHSGDLGMPHLLLQLENAVHQSLAGRWASRHINIHRHDSVTSSRHTVRIVVVSATIRTTTHADDPSRLRHLIIHLSQRRSHLVGKRACYNHNVRLAWRGTEDYTEAILIVTWCRQVHHFDGAACETECHGPEGALPCPVRDLIECG